MDRSGGGGAATAVLNGLIKVLEIVANCVLVVMMLLTFVDVVGRYLIGAPVFGASEMISAMLALVIFCGLGIANARDRHIVVELFDSRVRRLSPSIYDFVVHGFSIFAMGLIVFVLWEQALHAAHNDTRTVVLEWPLSWITGVVATVAAVSIVCQVLGLMTGVYGGECVDEENAS